MITLTTGLDPADPAVTAREFRRAADLLDPPSDAPESDGQVLERMGINAAKWTDEFMRINPDVNIPDAWGVMVGWFANAIETGRAAGRRETDTTPPVHHPTLNERTITALRATLEQADKSEMDLMREATKATKERDEARRIAEEMLAHQQSCQITLPWRQS